MCALAVWQSFESARHAQYGLERLRLRRIGGDELRAAGQHLLDCARAGQEWHLARQGIDPRCLEPERSAHEAHGLPRPETDIDSQSYSIDHRKFGAPD